jgi:hypothetical protein
MLPFLWRVTVCSVPAIASILLATRHALTLFRVLPSSVAVISKNRGSVGLCASLPKKLFKFIVCFTNLLFREEEGPRVSTYPGVKTENLLFI